MVCLGSVGRLWDALCIPDGFFRLRIPKYRASPWVFGLMGILPCGGSLSAMCAGEENSYDLIEL